MRRSEDRRGPGRLRTMRLAGTRTSWHTTDDGEFFCPDCGGDRSYRHRTGRRRYVLLGVPLRSRGSVGPVLECAGCRGHFAPEALACPTTNRLTAMLRDAVQSVSLAVLSAGGTDDSAARETAAETVREAGFPGCNEEQLLALLATLGTSTLDAELHESLIPLASHLAPAGRENLLLGGARIALADGQYLEAERDMLVSMGAALQLSSDDISRLLAEAARTPY